MLHTNLKTDYTPKINYDTRRIKRDILLGLSMSNKES